MSEFNGAIIPEGDDEFSGIEGEYKYIIKKFGDKAEVVMQRLAYNEESKSFYDILTVLLPNGTTEDVAFDINGFFGKFPKK